MTNFLICIHNHQPVGNFDSVVEESYVNSYWPFLLALSKHPTVKITLHNSGYLLEWLIANHPEYIQLLRAMVQRGQVEIMGGGYYEPILAVIPERDRIGQITKMSDRIEEVFGVRPSGVWLAERIWEPSLPSVLSRAGVDYLVVDDFHFIKAGLNKDELGGYYVTEDEGKVIKIFPGSEALRYLVPFQPVEKLEAHLMQIKSGFARGNAAIYGDDGEKFGSWPGTYKWVFEDGWLEGFFKMIEDNSSWLVTVTFGDYAERFDNVGRIYLPTTSYMEMGEWSLPAGRSREYMDLIEEIKPWKDAERITKFLQGGTWRNFFTKYPESNWMHKRMLGVSAALADAAGGVQDDAARHLYMAQCNDAYWHGVFGGLYLPHLRTELYRNLLAAEGRLDIGGGAVSVSSFDMDADGHDEIIVRTRDLNLFFSTHNGAALYELDHKPSGVNISNTLSRWHESYHYKLEGLDDDAPAGHAVSIHDMVKVKEKGLTKYLKFDAMKRASFVDRLLCADESFESFFDNTYKELGDFANGKYDVELKESGAVFTRSSVADGHKVSITKEAIAASDSFDMTYAVSASHAADGASSMRLGVEFNLLLPCCTGPACSYTFTPSEEAGMDVGLASVGELKGITSFALTDTHTGVSVKVAVDRAATLWRYPVYTVSLSEGGFEKIYQGSCLLMLFPLDAAMEDTNIKFNVKVFSLA